MAFTVIMTWDHIFQFGKKKYETVAEVYESDPDYLIWFRDNVNGYEFNDEISQAIIDYEDGASELNFGEE